MNTVVRRFGNDSSRGSAPNRSIYLEDACTPLSDSNRSCRPAPRSLITLFPTNRKDTRNCLCFLTNSISSSLTVPTQETNSFTSNNLFLYFFFFFTSPFFSFFPPLFLSLIPLSHVSSAEIDEISWTKFREKNAVGDLSRRDEINDLSWWVRRENGRNKNRKFRSFDVSVSIVFFSSSHLH